MMKYYCLIIYFAHVLKASLEEYVIHNFIHNFCDSDGKTVELTRKSSLYDYKDINTINRTD